MTCCTKGLVGRMEGDPIFCTCRDGLDAHMVHLATLMQTYAETLARLDAEKPLTPFQADAYKMVDIAFRQCMDEHDRLEVLWLTQEVNSPIV